jgi:sialate O-acetylesterase
MAADKCYFNNLKNIGLSLILLFICTGVSFAEVRLPAVISDNMVLQQQMKAPIWGWAEPNEDVLVKASWQSSGCSVKTGPDGKWSIRIDTPKAGGPYELVIEGTNKIILKNVLIGEVWVCSGQSNMEMPVKGWEAQPILNSAKEIETADYPMIRMFTVAQKVADQPQSDCTGCWRLCSPQTVGDFSAVAYFFGRELHQKLNVPVGLIHTSWGGTPAESWTSREVLQSDPDFAPIFERFEQEVAKYPENKAIYDKKLQEWEKSAAEAKTRGEAVPPKPWPEPLKHGHPHTPSGLYNAMICPLIPYGIKGAIWYQGESNAERAYQYRKLFPAMITNWRKAWGQGDFPFYFVQLANFVRHFPGKEIVPEKGRPCDDSWAELREAQLMTLNLSNTGMAVIIDIGAANNIHPGDKQDVGKRLSLWALAKDYGKDIVYSGPIYKKMVTEGNKIRLYFEHVGSGLAAKNGQLEGFAIAGSDKKFVWADAEIKEDTVLVSSREISEPVAVRYAWSIFPFCSLFNKEGLPASPFRTDKWAGITVDKK